MDDSRLDGWAIGIVASEDHDREAIARWAAEVGVMITEWQDAGSAGDGLAYHAAIATITPTILDAMRSDGGWTSTAGDDEPGITIKIDPGDVDLGPTPIEAAWDAAQTAAAEAAQWAIKAASLHDEAAEAAAIGDLERAPEAARAAARAAAEAAAAAVRALQAAAEAAALTPDDGDEAALVEQTKAAGRQATRDAARAKAEGRAARLATRW